MLKTSLFEFILNLLKIFKIKNVPDSYCEHVYFIVSGPRQ